MTEAPIIELVYDPMPAVPVTVEHVPDPPPAVPVTTEQS